MAEVWARAIILIKCTAASVELSATLSRGKRMTANSAYLRDPMAEARVPRRVYYYHKRA